MSFEDKNKNKNFSEDVEDTTKYGEFVSTYFGWITLEEQKKKAKQMENMTDKNK